MLDTITIHFPIGGFASWDPPQHSRSSLRFKTLDGRVKQFSVIEMVLIVMCKWIAMFSHNLPTWVDFHHDTTPIFLPKREQARRIWVNAIIRKVAIFQYLSVAAWAIRELPLVHDFTAVGDKFDGSRTGEVCE